MPDRVLLVNVCFYMIQRLVRWTNSLTFTLCHIILEFGDICLHKTSNLISVFQGETWNVTYSGNAYTIRFSSLVITTFRVLWNAVLTAKHCYTIRWGPLEAIPVFRGQERSDDYSLQTRFFRLHPVKIGRSVCPGNSATVERLFSHNELFMRPHKARLGTIFFKTSIHQT